MMKSYIFILLFVLAFLFIGCSSSGTGKESNDARILPVVNTLPAADIEKTNATMVGYINTDNYNTTYWFEYGTSVSKLINFSASQNIITSKKVSSVITGLKQNSQYFFRIAAKNNKGKSYGEILTFKTK